MGRTHEALERAEKEYERSLPLKADPAPKGNPRRPTRIVRSRNGGEHYQGLKVNLLARYPDKTVRTIVFCGTTHGDGATTTAVNFAATLAKDCQLKVLLVDVNLRTPGLHDVCGIDHAPGLSDYIGNGNNPAPMTRVGRDNFYVIPCGTGHAVPVSLFESKRFDQFLREMREKFDYVILDAPPVPRFSESRVICPKVDGVILVLGGGKTRQQVALNAKEKLEQMGAKVLGFVINRRKFYIPNWIYKRL